MNPDNSGIDYAMQIIKFLFVFGFGKSRQILAPPATPALIKKCRQKNKLDVLENNY